MLRYVLGLLLVLSIGAPARADHMTGTEVTFEGAIPCAVACSYWVDNGYRPCENPFPPGSWADHITSAAPAAPEGKIVLLEGEIDPLVDWDAWFCANTPERTELACFCNLIEPQCEHVLGQDTLIGCQEHGAAVVTPGQTVIFRAYNWSDPAPARGVYRYLVV